MNQSAPFITTGGRYDNMMGFELDKLFGLALTDARFFRELREHPYQAVAQFELTEPEEQAVLHIAPRVESIQELALRLDAWMAENTASPVKAPAEVLILDARLRVHQMWISHRMDRDASQTSDLYLHQDSTQIETGKDEQRICLKLNEYISQS